MLNIVNPKLLLCHTASIWNITILQTSHDDLASRLIWSWQNSTEAVFSSNRKVQFWISVIWQVFSFWFTVKWEKYFSVKSSREVHWIVMFQKDAVCYVFLKVFLCGRHVMRKAICYVLNWRILEYSRNLFPFFFKTSKTETAKQGRDSWFQISDF